MNVKSNKIIQLDSDYPLRFQVFPRKVQLSQQIFHLHKETRLGGLQIANTFFNNRYAKIQAHKNSCFHTQFEVKQLTINFFCLLFLVKHSSLFLPKTKAYRKLIMNLCLKMMFLQGQPSFKVSKIAIRYFQFRKRIKNTQVIVYL